METGCDNAAADPAGTGSGGELSKNTYTVTIGTLTNANGSTISAYPASGPAGTEITLTINEANGYRLKAGTLRYGTTPVNETTQKFYLPANNVIITAEFESGGSGLSGGSVPGSTLIEQLLWLKTNVLSGSSYTLVANGDEGIGPQSLAYPELNGSTITYKSGITITLKGNGGNRTVSLNANGTMFSIGSGVTLVLDGNITLRGLTGNNNSLVRVASGATLVMNDGSFIKGNSGGSYSPGGVDVAGTFTMNGGEISGNSGGYADSGGVSVSGTFIMNNGKITGNTSTNTGYGGGVYVSGTFTMIDGEISGNTASIAGGVNVVSSGTFTMSGGNISGNTATGNVGGVNVVGTFTMSGSGKISGNMSSGSSGGISVSGTFTMNNGEISGNTSSGSGGGVYVSGTFSMNNGTISGNTAVLTANPGYSPYGSGGGVFVDNNSGKFIKSGGTITGYNSDTVNGNVVKNNTGAVLGSRGHAVSVNEAKRKESTAGPDLNLSYDGTASPTWSGGWDY